MKGNSAGHVVLIGGVVMVAVSLAVAYHLYHRFVPENVSDESIVTISRIRACNSTIIRREEFVPPSSNMIDEKQFYRFLEVQRTIQRETTTFDSLCTILSEIRNTPIDSPKRLRTKRTKMLKLSSEAGPWLIQIKKVQVRALNEQGFSIAEFRWVRESILRAMGQPSSFYLEEPTTWFDPIEFDYRVPPENAALIRSAASTLESWLPIAIIGF